jgi:2',3'-cyclic-nucleotide 2'-phosphodiesterase / 3'-nucleotidase / 5'-nucleotidase
VTLPSGRRAFGDTRDSVHHSAINDLAAAGVVRGVTTDSYAPRQRLTREQMASMLVGAYGYMTKTTPPAPAVDYFTDDNGSVHEGRINTAAELGLTVGRSPGVFAPREGMRRDQMASFLTRLLDAAEE